MSATPLEASFCAALANPEAALAELDRLDSQESLSAFLRLCWHIVEPSRALKYGWHLDAIAEHLEAVTAGQIKRLLINIPPGTMKSLFVSVVWNAWEWGPKGLAGNRFLTTSYREGLAVRDNTRARRLINSDWFQARWPLSLVSDQNSKLKFENDKAGWRQAMGFKSLTGERGDRVVVDDPLSVDQAKSAQERLNAQETLLEAVPTRLNDPEESAIAMVMQRLHEQDPAGVALEKDLGYVHLMLPMEFEAERACYTIVKPAWSDAPARLGRYDATKQQWYFDGDEVPEKRRSFVESAPVQRVYLQDQRDIEGQLLFPERFPAEVVERDKRSLGAMAHAGQNQQRPAPREGGMFQRANFKSMRLDEVPDRCQWVRAWDLAATETEDAAQTCGVKMGRAPDDRIIIGHGVRVRYGPAKVRELIKHTAIADGKPCKISIPQDPGQAGKAQVLDFVKLLHGYRIRTSPETGDKVVRAEPFAAQVEAGNVWIVEGPWVDGFLDEVCMFPNGKFMDAVDALSRAYMELVKIPKGVAITGRSAA